MHYCNAVCFAKNVLILDLSLIGDLLMVEVDQQAVISSSTHTWELSLVHFVA